MYDKEGQADSNLSGASRVEHNEPKCEFGVDDNSFTPSLPGSTPAGACATRTGKNRLIEDWNRKRGKGDIVAEMDVKLEMARALHEARKRPPTDRWANDIRAQMDAELEIVRVLREAKQVP